MAKVTKTTGRRRLATLAAFLERLKPTRKRRYDQSVYYGERRKRSKADPDTPTAHVCGSAACALGYATTIPAFRRAGLRLGELRPGPDHLFDKRHIVLHASVCYGRVRDDVAARRFFGIDEFTVLDFFGPGAARPKDVARRIRRYLAGTCGT